MAIDISKSAIPLFQSQDRLQLLNDIDKFRKHGLDHLPQIVVGGDTSSGKSSVLEALSGIPFPVDSTLCTRFATEIALRYSPHHTVLEEVYITPGPRSSEDHREGVQSFKKTHIDSLDEIPDILREAQKVMGVGEAGGISRDVLHLKLKGRELPNLTLVDLPGLIHSATNKADIDNVRDLIQTYFSQEESLIMVIVSAENPIENQGVLSLSQKFDPKGERTIGVITKPDILQRQDKARLTPTVLQLARNEHAGFKFKRDWQIMRCLTDDERQNGADRDQIETDLFLQDPWDGFDKKRLGTKSLRAVLCEYLEQHILHLLPELILSLEGKIASTKVSLQELGPHRATHDERRQYLIRISRRYVQIVRDALNGDYSDSFFDGIDAGKRLRAKTMALTDKFDYNMHSRGHAFEIVEAAPSTPTAPDEPQRITIADALVKVGKLIEGYRGPELPVLFNPRLVGELFKGQSQKWPKLSAEYTESICKAVKVFLWKVIDSICPNTARVGRLIFGEVFEDAIRDHQDKLNSKISELFAPHTGSFLYSTKIRLEASLMTVQNADKAWADDNDAASVDSASSHPSSRTPSSSSDPRLAALQLSRAYYKVALETFIDNVVVLGVESCLLSKLEEMFSPETVALMKEDKLQLLGGETPEMITERTELVARLKTLETALKNCRRHASREFGLDLDRIRETTPRPASESLRSGSRYELQAERSFQINSTVNASPVPGKAAPAASSETPKQQPPINSASTPKPVTPAHHQSDSNTLGTPTADDQKSSPGRVSPVPQPTGSQPPAPNTASNAIATGTSYSSERLFGGFGGVAAAQSSNSPFGPPSTGSNVVYSSGIPSGAVPIFGGSGSLAAAQSSKPAFVFPNTGLNAVPSSGISGPVGGFGRDPAQAPRTSIFSTPFTGASPFGASASSNQPASSGKAIFGFARHQSSPIIFDLQKIQLPPFDCELHFLYIRLDQLRTRLNHGPEYVYYPDHSRPETLRCLAACQSTSSFSDSFEEIRLRDYKNIFSDEIRKCMAGVFPSKTTVPYGDYMEGVRKAVLTQDRMKCMSWESASDLDFDRIYKNIQS